MEQRLDHHHQENDLARRKPSYPDILTRSGPSSRISSRTSLLPRSNNENYNNLSRKNSRNDIAKGNPDKDKEIQTLKSRLAEYERQQPKNGMAPLEGGTPSSSKQKTNQEIIDYISATMKNLELFKNQLSN